MTSYSTLTILLILIAALSTPAAAVNRKLQRRKGRKLSSKSSKCTKVAKASCIHIVMDDLEAKYPDDNNFVDIAMQVADVDVIGPVKERATGTTWLSNGRIQDPDGTFAMKDYFYFITCDVLKGNFRNRPNIQFIDIETAICHLDICIGSTYTDDDGGEIPDCVYLKGFINTGKDGGEAFIKTTKDQQISNVAPFYAMIVSGTGRFTGSIGNAYIQPSGPNGDFGDNTNNWFIDLDASVSPWFNSELVEDEDPAMRSEKSSAMFASVP